nr:unnamed protein product [Digitaria exilis]
MEILWRKDCALPDSVSPSLLSSIDLCFPTIDGDAEGSHDGAEATSALPPATCARPLQPRPAPSQDHLGFCTPLPRHPATRPSQGHITLTPPPRRRLQLVPDAPRSMVFDFLLLYGACYLMQMVSSFRHSRNGHSKRSASHTNSCDGASQKTTADNPSKRIKETRPICSLQPVKERGRKQGCLTKLKMPVRGRKVLLKPLGDIDLGKKVPSSLKSRLAALTTNLPTGSSHAGDEESEDEDVDEDFNAEDLDEEELDEEDLDREDSDDEDMDGQSMDREDLDGDNMDGKNKNGQKIPAVDIDNEMEGGRLGW